MEDDKRIFPRVRISFPVECQSLANKKFFYTVFKDISKGGLKLLSDEFIKIDSKLKIEINLIDQIIKGVGKVVWCQQQPYGDHYTAGVQFTEIDQNDEKVLSSFLSQINPS